MSQSLCVVNHPCLYVRKADPRPQIPLKTTKRFTVVAESKRTKVQIRDGWERIFCGLAKFLNPVSWRHDTEYYNNLDFFWTYFRVRLALPSTLNNNSHIICFKAMQCTFISKRNGATTSSQGTQTFLRFWQLYFWLGLKADYLCSYTKHTARLKTFYKVVQIWPGQTVTCLHTNRPSHIWTTLYYSYRVPDQHPNLVRGGI